METATLPTLTPVKELPSFVDAAERAEIAQQAARELPEVVDAASLETATEILGQVSTARKQIDAKRKEAKGPSVERGKQIDAEFKELASPITAIEERIKGEILRCHREERERAIKEQQRQDKLARERQARENKRAEKEARPPVEHHAPQVAQPEATIKTASGAKAAISQVWKYRLVDISKVPEGYLALDEAAVGKAVRGGVREIEGIEIYADEQLSSRQS